MKGRPSFFKLVAGLCLLGLLTYGGSSVFSLQDACRAADGLLDRSHSNQTSSSSSSSNDDEDRRRQQRLLHYFQTYRYVLPAKRGDHNQPHPARECGEGNSTSQFAPFFQLGNKDRSRLREDEIIFKTVFANHALVTNEQVGTYVELGAFDGRTESNTRFFDVCLGWKGLLIEGNPESFHNVLQNRPFAHKMSLAPSCQSSSGLSNRTIQFYRYPMTNVGLVDKARTYEGKPTVDVPCGPLQPILQDVFLANQGEIHFFSLDVEGAESLVLNTIDFTGIFIHVMMIEVVNVHCKAKVDCQVRNDVRQLMKEAGYWRYSRLVGASDVYVHPQSPYQVPPSVARPDV
mmetsp:Transcript_18796/g.51473  ORF Transcript_18796/g.51473 Transcript_18796/m.51473 type:complete len:345 (+) Transcript_18796:211-1245(+)|eukprot:CAMPEP_0168726482 /NCGR_PEP_ID=MMETSP0724-20121128/4690_1 /TAXON_ID=265536 /ORGANISM="Amphiprora sp., Strain CCMP467" /LENGTH=344 /DNA_ID=CAMNT_0008773295 /DNA_START=121 /DNA_END=1155 /DNA_ORIENTATION=-